ncbi:MAG: hypothetical protein WD872_18975 [Pirellulaceae bacterium]
MSTHTRPKLKVREFERNRQLFTNEQLLPYAGQWVAFSLDGARVVAASADLDKLPALVAAAGGEISNVELEYITVADDDGVGGWVETR